MSTILDGVCAPMGVLAEPIKRDEGLDKRDEGANKRHERLNIVTVMTRCAIFLDYLW